MSNLLTINTKGILFTDGTFQDTAGGGGTLRVAANGQFAQTTSYLNFVNTSTIQVSVTPNTGNVNYTNVSFSASSFSIVFDGGSPTSVYSSGPVFDCGGIT